MLVRDDYNTWSRAVLKGFARCGAVFALILTLIAPALWNGYPLIFFDSEDFVDMSFTFKLLPWRTMPYALLLSVGRPFGTLFAVIVVQAGLSAWVIHELVASFLPNRRTLTILLFAALLGPLTSLPWVTSQLLADALTGLPALGIAVLAFGEDLPRWRRIALIPPIAIAISAHMSHVAVAAGMLLGLGLMHAMAWRWPAWPRPALGLSVLTVTLGIAIVPAVHRWATGEAAFYRARRILQLGAFVQNGIAKRYLDAVCPEGAALKLCRYRSELPTSSDAFLWWAGSPFEVIGGWENSAPEAERVVVGAIRRFPGLVLQESLRATVAQLKMINLGDGLEPKITPDAGGEFYDTANSRYPQEFADYLDARQQRGTGIDFRAMNAVQVPVAVAAQIALLVLLAVAWQRRDRRAAGLALIVGLALLGNAAVCGAASSPHDRYQNRIVWIAPAACLLIGFRLSFKKRHEHARCEVWRSGVGGWSRG